MLKRRREHYANNRMLYRERLKKFRQENPEKIKEYKKRDYLKHRQKYLEYKKQYYNENRHRLKEKAKRMYRAWRNERLDQLGRKCVRCGYSEFECALDIHHITGKKDSDLVVLCRNCHHSLHNGKWRLEELVCEVLA